MDKKLKQKLVGIVAVGVILTALPFLVKALGNVDSEMWFSSYNVEATIKENGDLDMHETYYVRNNQDYHTYFREIEYGKNQNGIAGNKASFDESSFKISVSNSNVDYEDITTPFGSGNNLHDLIGFSWTDSIDELGEYIRPDYSNSATAVKFLVYLVDGLEQDTKIDISYTIKGAVTKYTDVSELNWKLVPDQDVKMKNVTLTLNYPENSYPVVSKDDSDETEGIFVYGHGGGNSQFDSITNTQLKASSKSLGNGSEIEIRTFFPSSMTPDVPTQNSSDKEGKSYLLGLEKKLQDTEESFVAERKVFTGVSIAAFVLLVGLFGYLYYHVYTKYDKELTPSFQEEYYRELPADYPAAEMGYLYRFKNVTKDDLDATLMDLMNRKFITIDYQGTDMTEKKPNYTLKLDRSKDTSKLKSYEKLVLTWFFDDIGGGTDTLKLDQIDTYMKKESNVLKYRENNKRFIDCVTAESKKRNFFDDDASKGAKKYQGYTILGILAIFFFFFVLITYKQTFIAFFIGLIFIISVFFSTYVVQVKRRTQSGNEDYAKWKGFEHFLKEFSHFDDYPIPSIIIWEKYLVYATAFGIADLVEKQLRTKFKELGRTEEYNSSTAFRYNTYTYFHYRLASSVAIGNTTIRNAQAARMRSSSHSGGRGGFGGGSSFGGGGGHSGGR